jgi:thymidylate kinase
MRPIEAAYNIGAIGRSFAEDATLPGLVTVLSEFHRQRISYCYWKSSRHLQAMFAGEGDVDLLIARDDQHRAQAILLERDFKLFPSVAVHDHSAILSFLGYDQPSGQLIHLHLHFRLIVGERLLQNYRIPWEEVLLARAIRHQALPIWTLDPTSEAVLLVVRACLELRRLDPVTLRGWQATTRKFALDRAELAARVDRTTLRKLATELLSEDLAESVADALYGGRPLERQASIRRRIRKHCAAYRSYNVVEARVRSAGRAVLWVAGNLNKHFLHAPRPWNRRAPGGGCMVAMIGVDGSGKSTSVATMRAWLGSKIDVVPIYFGTGDGRPSLLLWPFKLMFPLIMRMLKNKPKVASHGKISGHAPGLLYNVLLIFWALAVALDKRKKLTTARRGTNRGLIVLADRYPQNQILRFNDGPLLTRLTVVPHWLCWLEGAVYARARRLPPDLVIKLAVTPETAARREPAMDPAIIRERIAALQHLEFPGARVMCVDAEQPLPEVIRAVKHEIWRLL